MKTIFKTLSFLPLTVLAVGAVIAPVQAQSMQNGQPMQGGQTMQNSQTISPASTTNSPDRIGIDASDPYSEQVYSGSQDTNTNNANTTDNQLSVTSNASANMPMQQSLSRLQQMRYEVLDRPSS